MITTEETDTEMREMTTKDETETDPIPTKIAKRNTMTTLEKVGTETSDGKALYDTMWRVDIFLMFVRQK